MMKSTTPVTKKPYANLSMEQVRKDLDTADKAGRSVFHIDFNEPARESGDGAVTYRNVYWVTSDNKTVIPIVEFKYNFICATKPLETRKISKVKKAQLSITKRKPRDGMDDKDIKKLSADEETFTTLLKIDRAAVQYIKDCIDDDKLEDGIPRTNAQYSLSKKTLKDNKDAKMDDPFIRYEFKIGDKMATEFYDDNEKNYNPAAKRFEYTEAAKKNDITNENIHTAFTSESFVRTQLAFSMNSSQYGQAIKAFVKRVYYRTNIKPQNLQSIEATDDDVEDYEEYKRMKESLAALSITQANNASSSSSSSSKKSGTSNNDIDGILGDSDDDM